MHFQRQVQMNGYEASSSSQSWFMGLHPAREVPFAERWI